MVDEARILVAEAVVVLAPDMARQQIVQRPDRPPPGDVVAHLQPLGVLVEHRVDDVDEGLVAREEAVPAGQQIAFEPALALVLAEHLHDPPVGGEMVVVGIGFRHPGAVGDLEHVLPAVRVAFVGAEQAEVARFHVQLHHVAQEAAHHPGRLGGRRAGRRHLDRVVAEIRQPQIAQQQAAIGMRVGAHAPLAARRQLGQLRPQPAVVVEQFLRPVALHPVFEDAHVLGVVVHLAHRHLVRAPVTLGAPAVDFLRAGPPLGVRSTIIGQRGRSLRPVPRVRLDALDLADDGVQRRRHQLVHRFGVVALDEIRGVAVAAEQLVQFLVADPGQERRVGDLVAVEVQDRQHRAVRRRVQKLVRVPARRQRSGFRLAVADDAGDDQIGVVERRAIGVRQRIAELAAFVDRTRRLRRDVARDAAGKRELREQPLHPRLVRRRCSDRPRCRCLRDRRSRPAPARHGPGR